MMDVAPTRSFKTFTSNEVMEIFDKEFWIDLGSDFTFHSLRHCKEEISKGKCLLVNDATLLFATKSQRTKERIINGFSELIADEEYTYGDFAIENKFKLAGKVTAIMNFVPESFENYKDRFFGLTFAERFLIQHHATTKMEKEEWVSKEEQAQKIHYSERITVDDIVRDAQIPEKYFSLVKHIAEEFSYMSMRSFVGSQDLIKATLRAHASLNKRGKVCADDFQFVLMLKKYLVDRFSPYEGLIVKYRAQGLSIGEISCKIGKSNYSGQIQRVIKKAEMRGLLDSKSPQNWCSNNHLERS